MNFLSRVFVALPIALLSPLLVGISALALALVDLIHIFQRPRPVSNGRRPNTNSASVVIPNWNGRDHLARNLPSVVEAMSGSERNEIIVVDNASEDDSRELLRREFPGVRILELPTNRGFGGGCNAGVSAATNDIVILLNNDMQVESDFLHPLLEAFSGDDVFSVSCQIFFKDPDKIREETGLTQAWWSSGALRVRHRIDDKITGAYPCFYGGGGSSAYDRRKFQELGGFDSLLEPFYLEDTDLGYMAWKRGWRVLYEPRSRVYHEHRGTIAKRFTEAQIQAVLQKNFILFAWKNIHDWRLLSAHFARTVAGTIWAVIAGIAPGRPGPIGTWNAFLKTAAATRSRWRARHLARVTDAEAFRRPLGAYYRDRFHPIPQNPEKLNVLFVSPYPICPPVHGGAVFMEQTCTQLVKQVNLHLLVMIERPDDVAAHRSLAAFCESAEFVLRSPIVRKAFGSMLPYAVREFESDELHWAIHREACLREADVIQLEYLSLAQYGGDFRRIALALFEHDIYFQSVGRLYGRTRSLPNRLRIGWEYMRALRYELRALRRFDRVQVCSNENAGVLSSFLPEIEFRLDAGHRAGIDVSRYRFQQEEREPDTMLFIGSFRHAPNREALGWFISSVLPQVVQSRPRAKLMVVGGDESGRELFPNADAVEWLGTIENIQEPLGRYAVFVCPILTGSGVRVKLLEAFAAGIPTVSTRLGAEGLTNVGGECCLLADEPSEFASKVLQILDNPATATDMVRRARQQMESGRDIARMTTLLVESYAAVVERKRKAASGAAVTPIGHRIARQ